MSPESTILDSLEQAIDAGAHRRDPRSARLVHLLARAGATTLYDELTTARRVGLHRRIGEVLETEPEIDASSLAHHWSEAAGAGGSAPAKATRYARDAGRSSDLRSRLRRGGPRLRAGPGIRDDSGSWEARCELCLALGRALLASGDLDQAIRGIRGRRGDRRRTRRRELFAQAAMGIAAPWSFGIVDDARVEVLEAALDRLPDEDSAIRARVLYPTRSPPRVRHVPTAGSAASRCSTRLEQWRATSATFGRSLGSQRGKHAVRRRSRSWPPTRRSSTSHAPGVTMRLSRTLCSRACGACSPSATSPPPTR